MWVRCLGGEIVNVGDMGSILALGMIFPIVIIVTTVLSYLAGLGVSTNTMHGYKPFNRLTNLRGHDWDETGFSHKYGNQVEIIKPMLNFHKNAILSELKYLINVT